MKSRYFYLDIECGKEQSRVSVRRAVEEAARSVFGECGAGALDVDVLRAERGRALLRVTTSQLRRVHAALTLAAAQLRVRAVAPTLQALL